MKLPNLYDILSYEDENKEVPEEDKDKVVIYTTSLGVNRELVANCNRAIQIIRSYKVNKFARTLSCYKSAIEYGPYYICLI